MALKLTRLKKVSKYLASASANSIWQLCAHFGFIVFLYAIICETIPITDIGLTNQGLHNFMDNEVQFDKMNGETGYLSEVVNLDDIVGYSEALVNHLLADDSYIKGGRPADEHLMLLRVHRLINSIVFVQRRVASSDCSYIAMRPLYERCYEDLDSHEMTFGKMELGNGMEIPYSERLNGFAVELPLHMSDAMEMLAELKEGGYWDRATRQFTVLFALHNSPGHFTGNIRTNFDISPFGNVKTHVLTQFLRLHPYSEEVSGTFFLGLQVWGLTIYFVLFGKFLHHLYKQPHARWRIALLIQPWTILEMASHCLLLVSVGLWYVYITSPDRKHVDFASPHFQHILHLGDEFQNYIFFVTAALLLWTVRMIQFFQAFESKEAKKLGATVEAIFTSMGYLVIIVGVVFMGFCFAGHILFGPQVIRFNSLFATLGTLLLWFVALSGGQRDIFDLEGGPFFLILFIFVAMIVLFNMFIALVMAAHDDVLQDLEAQEQELYEDKGDTMADDIKQPWNYEYADKIADFLGLSKFRFDPFHDPSLTMTPEQAIIRLSTVVKLAMRRQEPVKMLMGSPR